MANLVAQGRTRDMIVVFPNMFAKTDPDQKPDFNSEAVLPYDNFINDLVKEFPMEYSVELRRLIDLEMEDSIG